MNRRGFIGRTFGGLVAALAGGTAATEWGREAGEIGLDGEWGIAPCSYASTAEPLTPEWQDYLQAMSETIADAHWTPEVMPSYLCDEEIGGPIRLHMPERWRVRS